jgi:serine/threonine protein kinase/Tfp pilus assembly protein PilF
MISAELRDAVSSAGLSAEQTTEVLRVLEGYLAELECGGQPQPDQLLARHPELAEHLKVYLEQLELLHEAALRFRDTAAPAANVGDEQPRAELGQLGDFQLLREIGRGGMGIVYEAEQTSLHRRVALKVLPFAATLDGRHLQRFQNESRAAACLQHPHIVPVHAVGCERGVHYYAMQFIEGQSLEALLREMRLQPAPAGSQAETKSEVRAQTSPLDSPQTSKEYFRHVANLMMQAAEALEHAHQSGVVHRDIKPANLLLDAHGNLWVTDFGLAQFNSDARVTMTGDLVGTLRYMSPEQALAKRTVVDHRTDVYSLGATLYEMLTLQPAFAGKDREELLRQIAFEEPTPPRRINQAIPAELETIIVKAMAKEPADRYVTAKELAEDLGCFLEHRPIRAKRPTLAQRARKWSQRHRPLVRATAVFFVVAIVGLAVSVFLLLNEREQTRKALAEAQANHIRADTQRQRAESNFREAFWTIEALLAAYDPSRTWKPLTVADLQQFQTGEALRFLYAVCEQPSEDPTVRLHQGVAYVHIARVYQVLTQHDKSQQALRQAIVVFDRLAADFPDDPVFAFELGGALNILAEDLYAAGHPDDAKEYHDRAVGVWRDAIRTRPAHVDNVFQLVLAEANCYDPRLRDLKDAMPLARKAVALNPHHPKSLLALGVVSYRSGDCSAAADALREALRQWKRGDWTKAQIFGHLAMAQWKCGQKAAAKESYWQAVELMERNFDARDLRLRAEAASVLGVMD